MTSARLHNALRRHRLRLDGLTQQALAERVGVTRQTILSIEKRRYAPRIGLALRLARALGVALEDLFWLEAGGRPGPGERPHPRESRKDHVR